jgi:hypothetical protein
MEVAGLTATHPTTEALLPTSPLAVVLLAPGLLLPVADTVTGSPPLSTDVQYWTLFAIKNRTPK